MLVDKRWVLNIMTRVLTSSWDQFAVLWAVYQRVVEAGYGKLVLSTGHC